jgi:hypothetical protein
LLTFEESEEVELEPLRKRGNFRDRSVVLRHLAKAVIATLGEVYQPTLFERLAAFSSHDWSDSREWLDISGLELYLLERIKTLGIEGAVPVGVLAGMERNHADNKIRTASLFEELSVSIRPFSANN